MDTSTSLDTTGQDRPHHEAAHEHEHHELGFWRKYIFSTDHKVIGIQYGLCGLVFLLFGFSLMMIMRWQLAYPGQALPVLGKWLPYFFGANTMPEGKSLVHLKISCKRLLFLPVPGLSYDICRVRPLPHTPAAHNDRA